MSLRLLLVLLAMVLPTCIAWTYFVALATEGGRPNPGLQLAYSGGKIVQFSLPVLAVWTYSRRFPRPGPLSARGLTLGLGFGLLVGAAIVCIYGSFLRDAKAFATAPDRIRQKLAEFGLDSPGGFILIGAFLSVLHSLLEEYYWRWFVFGELRRLVPVVRAIVLSSLAFMAHHVIILAVFFPGALFTVVVPLSLCIAVGGAVWAWLYHRTGSIYAPWLSHLLVDTAIMVVGFEMLYGYPGSLA